MNKMIRTLLFVSFLLPAFSHPALPISLRAAGQTLEPCQQNSDCLPPRFCAGSESSAQCSPNATCICVPAVAPQPCSNSDDCEQGELCAAGLPLISFSCASGRIVDISPDLREVDATSDTPMGLNEGLSLDQCRTDLQCRGNLQCSVKGSDTVLPCDKIAASCVCTPPTGLQNCTASAQCRQREICVRGAVNTGDGCIGKVIADQNDDIAQIDAVADRAGLTFDPCRSDSDCRSVGNGLSLCVGPDKKLCGIVLGSSCTCMPFDGIRYCGNNGDCPPGEVCAQGLAQKVQYEGNCMSSSFVDRVDSVDEYDGPGNGGTMLPCFSSGGCESDKMCADTNTFESSSLSECESTSFACLCVPNSGVMFCKSSAECPDGEVCATNTFADPFCMSRLAIDGIAISEVLGQSPGPDFVDDGGIGPSPEPLEVDEATPEPLEEDGLTLDACVGISEVGGCKNQRICQRGFWPRTDD